MKKCTYCDLVYNMEERIHCIYCGEPLVDSEDQATPDVQDKQFEDYQGIPLITQMVQTRHVHKEGRMQYVLGSYLKHRTSRFIYLLNRNEFRLGKTYNRFFVQPVNIITWLSVPWMVYNLFDSLRIRETLDGFCEACGWKYKRQWKNAPHNPGECEYCQDYNIVIDDILSGRITMTEKDHVRRAAEKAKAGKKSAYRELCFERKFFPIALDVASAWISVLLFVVVFVRFIFPTLSGWISKSAKEEERKIYKDKYLNEKSVLELR